MNRLSKWWRQYFTFQELMSFLQKQDSTKHIVVTSASGGHRPIERKVIVTTPGQLEATRQVVHTEKVVL